MEYINFLKNRKSVRDFKDESLSLEEINKIKEIMKQVEENGGDKYIKFNLVSNPQGFYEDLDGKAGYSGIMIKAPEYVAIQYKDMKPMNILQGAVAGSELVTQVKEMDLGTCWLTLGDRTKEAKEDHFGLVGDNVYYAIALGKAAEKRPFSGKEFSVRKSVDEIVFIDHEFKNPATNKLVDLNMDELFAALRYAPSNRNQQPWRFVIDKGEVTLYLEKGYSPVATLTDGGIIMYYFQKLAENMGLRDNWKIDLVDNGDFWKVGTYKL